MDKICSVTPVACKLLGIETPRLSGKVIPGPYKELISKNFQSLDHLVIYAPDAVGSFYFAKEPDLFRRISAESTAWVELASVMPTVTPVCFASMFTGAEPEVHGIQSYVKPVLTCDTLFDSCIRNELKTALCAPADSSIHKLFLNRDIDYFITRYDPIVTADVVKLISETEHRLIVAYHQEYDDLLHRSGVFSEFSEKAVHSHISTYISLIRKCKEHYSEKRWAVMFCPDHGAHNDPVSGTGTHGTDSEDDLSVFHFIHISQ